MKMATSLNYISDWRKFKFKNDTLYHLTFGEWKDSTKAVYKRLNKYEFSLYYPKENITHIFYELEQEVDLNNETKLMEDLQHRYNLSTCYSTLGAKNYPK